MSDNDRSLHTQRNASRRASATRHTFRVEHEVHAAMQLLLPLGAATDCTVRRRRRLITHFCNLLKIINCW